MRNWLEPEAFTFPRPSGLNSVRRTLLLPALALAFGLLLAGCSFLQPDFSAGLEPQPTAGPARAESPTAAAPEPTRLLTQPVAAEVNEPAPITEAAPVPAAVAEPDRNAATEADPAPADAAAATETTETAGNGAAGPLSNILGDNVTQVTPPGEGDGGSSPPPQLSGLSPTDIVAAREQVLKDIYDSSLPSVVLIRVSRNLGPLSDRPDIPDIPGIPDDFFERSGGTGFVWDDQGHIITNHHVVTEADRLIVVLPNRVEMEAEFLGSDPDSDLAVIKVSDPDNLLIPVTLGDSDEVYMGQLAVAIGNPFGQEFSITTGIISGIGRTIRSGHSPFSIPEVLQTDAPINPGNSGGPLLDRKGHVIGVNTQIISRTGVNSGIGFAVPVNIAKSVVPDLIQRGEYHYSWLGISGASVLPDAAEAMALPRATQGALVVEVVPGSPAHQAGLQGSRDSFMLEGRPLPIGGDIIVAIDGTAIDSIDDVIAFLVGKTRPGQEVVMDVIRDGQPEQLTVTLGTRPGP